MDCRRFPDLQVFAQRHPRQPPPAAWSQALAVSQGWRPEELEQPVGLDSQRERIRLVVGLSS